MKPFPINHEVEARLNAWKIAREIAQDHPTIENGIKAGMAWAHWLELFEPGDKK